MRADQIDAACHAIYDTVLDPKAVPHMLFTLSGLFRCHFADSFRRTHDYSHWHGVQIGLDEADYQDVFLGKWMTANVWGKRRPTRRAGDVVVTRGVASQAELMASDMYEEYLGPRGLHEGLRLDSWAGDGWIEDVSLLRRWSDGPFEPAELEVARSLSPHLCRAAATRRRLQGAEAIGRSGFEAMDRLQVALMLLDGGGRLRHANAAAEAILRARDGLVASGGALMATDRGNDRSLQGVLGAACRAPAQSGAVRLQRPGGGPALSLIAMPVAGAEPVGGGPAVLVCVTRPDEPAALSPTHLTGLFGLTRGEATLAVALVGGQELREIAETSGRSLNTVRSLLARLMTKTETHRQSDLIRLLIRLPSGD